ncbi:MAG: tetratricopeptide repeat protein [Phycisphaerae bacterium]|nr:tetratricopeptide repeat protein [Phycisphaerae bacterium]
MATRVNTRFVVILAAALVGLGVVVGGVAVFLLRTSPAEHVRRGDSSLQAGKFREAAESYSRAVNKDPSNVAYLEKWIEALRKYTPTNAELANESYRKLVTAKRAVAAAKRTDVGAHKAYFDELSERSSFNVPTVSDMEQLVSEVDKAVAMFPAGDGSARALLRYSGIMRVGVMGARLELPEAERERALADLKAALEADPADAGSLDALVTWYLLEADRQKKRNDTEKAEKAEQSARDAVQVFLTKRSDDPGALGAKLRLESSIRASRAKAGETFQSVLNEVLPIGDQLTAAVRAAAPETLDREVVAQASQHWMQRGGAEGRGVAIELLDHALKGRPNDARLLRLQGVVEFQAREYAAAIERYQKLVDLPRQPTGFDAMIQEAVKHDALYQQASATLAGLDGPLTDDQRRDIIARARKLRDALMSAAGERFASLNLLDGRLMLAEGNLVGARRALAAYNEVTGQQDSMGLMILGTVLMQQNLTGEARKNFERVIELQPTNVAAMFSLAQIETGLGNYRRAGLIYETILQLDPTNKTAEERMAFVREVEKGAGSSDKVVALLSAVNQNLSGAKADLDAAIAMLRQGLADNDNDARLAVALATCLNGKGDKAGAIEALEIALKKRPNDQRIVDAITMVKAKSPLDGQLALIEASAAPDLDKHLRRHEAYKLAGDKEKSAAELAEAMKAAPEDPRVIEVAFLDAISREDFKAARVFVDLAIAKDLDQSRGSYFKGRWEAAQGKFREAAVSLDQATQADPFSPSKWRLLGEVRMQLSQLSEGLNALRRSLQVKPDSPDTVRDITRCLILLGRGEEALDFARANLTFGRADREFEEYYLSLEADLGERRKALEWRRGIAERNPANTSNRVSLTNLLVSERLWDEADANIAELTRSSEARVRFFAIGLRARWLAERGDAEAARKALDEFIAGPDGPSMDVGTYIEFGRYMASRGLREAGIGYLEAGRKVQSADSMEADRAIGDLNFESGLYEKSMEAYGRVIAAGKDEGRRLQKRSAECLLNLKKFAEVEKALVGIPDLESDLEATLLRAKAAEGLNDRVRAKQFLDRAVTTAPTNALPYYVRGEFLSREPDLLTDAEADLNQSLKLNRGLAASRNLLIEIYARAGQTDRALEVMRDAVAQNPLDDRARQRLIAELMNRGKESEAFDIAEKGAERRNTAVSAQVQAAETFARAGKWDKARDYFKRGFDLTKDLSLLARAVDASLQMPNANQEQSRQLLELAGVKFTDNAPLMMLRARINALAKDPKQAALDATDAFRLVATDDFGASSGYLRDLRLLYPNRADLSRFLKSIEPKGGFTDAMAANLARMKLEDQATRAEGLGELDSIAQRATTKEVKIAILRVLGTNLYADGQRGVAGSYEKAVKVFQALVDLTPDEPAMRNNLAFVLGIRLGQPKEALPHAERAAELSPNDPGVLDTLGAVALAVGELDKAELALRRAWGTAVSNADRTPVALHLAELLAKRAQPKEAQRFFNTAEKLTQTDRQLAELYKADVDRIRKLVGG